MQYNFLNETTIRYLVTQLKRSDIKNPRCDIKTWERDTLFFCRLVDRNGAK